ncbi:MAG: aldehyde dehydrogenase family protein, partial [Rhizomicrobium sp.]
PSAAALAFLARRHTSFIDGQFVAPGGGETIAVENPAREEIVGEVQAATNADIDLAVAAARRAFQTGWGAWAPKDRARVLLRVADLLEDRADLLGEIETIDSGIPIALTTQTIRGFCADLFRYYAGWATKLEGATIPAVANGREAQELLVYTVREPVGVVASIVPWNAPVSMFALKMAPALAAGCTLVMKPAELAPLAAGLVAELWSEAGGPPGAFNVIHGTGRDAGAALVRHKGVDKVSFTGSTAVGKEIVRGVSDDLRRVTLELGGKSPFIVFADAPMDEAVPAAALACFFLGGQNCMAGTRLFVHESVHDRFIEALARFTDTMTVGDGLDRQTVIGPMISAAHRAKVEGFITGACADGGKILYQGRVPQGPGHFVAPTIIGNVTPDMRIAREEVFGPVLAVQTFDDDEDALAQAVGATRYGLSGSVWTQDLRRAHRFARRIDSGQVGVNIHAAVSPETPFGGNRESGWGREFGREGLDAYLKTKAVSVNLGMRR